MSRQNTATEWWVDSENRWMNERMDGAGENEWQWSNRGLTAWAIHPPSIQITVHVKPANQSTVNLKMSQSQPPSGTLYWQSILL